jgi:peptidoglycan/xylan/chitin deacetylase (PgdA/CDA1 family)
MDDIYKRIISEGHVIGNHSYSHSAHLYASAVDFEEDLLNAKAFMYKKFNYKTTLFRFPGGSISWNKNVIKKRADILKNNGYLYFDWDVSTADTDINLTKYGDKDISST